MSDSTAAGGLAGGQPWADRPSIRRGRIDEWVDRARTRLGLNSALAATCRAGLWLFPLLALLRFGLLRIGTSLSDPAWMGALVVSILGAAFALAYLRRPSRLASALYLDERLRTSGLVAAAFELRQQAPTGYLPIALRQSEDRLLLATGHTWVLPLERPKQLGPFALVLTAFLAALAIRPEAPPKAARPPAAATDHEAMPVLLPAEELALLERRAGRLLEVAKSDRGRERGLEYARLIERLKSGTLDQRQALSAAAALERGVQEDAVADQGDRSAAEPSSGDPTNADGTKENERRADSAEALRRLAERLAQETSPPSRRELEKIREALEQAREERRREHEAATAQEARTAERLRDKERRLMAKKQERGLSTAEEAELEHTKRQLEHLDRRKKESERAESELDRQIAEAMRELAGNPRKAGEFLERAADTRAREESKQLTDDEKRELLEQLRALKERLRQDPQSDMNDKLRDFERRARGGEESSGEGQGPEQPGGGVSLVPRASQGEGRPSSGAGSPQPGEEMQAGSSTSTRPGTDHDPNWQGEATEGIEAKTRDTAAAARDTGEGGSESEAILTAAEEGFRAGAYERLYKDYQTVLEEMVRGETIPRGRRTEVERYFELIRPRSD